MLDVELARPRDRIALADDSQYNHYRHQVLSFLYEKQRKVEDMEQRRSIRRSEAGESSEKKQRAIG